MTVRLFTIHDVPEWSKRRDRRIFLGDVLDSSNSDAMSLTFGRYEKGEKNDWIVAYDEACIVTKGAYTVHGPDGPKTAKADEVIFLTKGAKVAYEGEEYGTEIVFVAYPHWLDAQRKSENSDLLETIPPGKQAAVPNPKIVPNIGG